MKRNLIIISFVLIAACQQTPSNTETNSKHFSHLKDAENELTRLIKDRSCDASYQCKVLPLGERTCGGASYYKIYSTKNTDDESIEFIASEITSFEKIYNKQSNAINSCQSTITPQTLCINKTCVKIP